MFPMPLASSASLKWRRPKIVEVRSSLGTVQRVAPTRWKNVSANPELRVVKEAPVHPRRITHAVLLTPQPQRLADFYTRVGGLREVARYKGGDVRLLAGSHAAYCHHLAICKADTAGYHHAARRKHLRRRRQNVLRPSIRFTGAAL